MGFRTDTDISGNTVMPERDLQRWEPSNTTDANLSLEGSGGSWDQFQVNEQRFGLKSDYDEDIYTTRIDKSRPDFQQREAQARRKAQEIEGTSANNIHTLEERGMIDEDDGLNEEEKCVASFFRVSGIADLNLGIVEWPVRPRISQPYSQVKTTGTCHQPDVSLRLKQQSRAPRSTQQSSPPRSPEEIPSLQKSLKRPWLRLRQT